jgi:hypothetical protein
MQPKPRECRPIFYSNVTFLRPQYSKNLAQNPVQQEMRCVKEMNEFFDVARECIHVRNILL